MCSICLENINQESYDKFKCNQCNNTFHFSCILNLKKNICPLCRSKIKYKQTYNNYTFNNMNSSNKYNIDYYIYKWNDKKCISSNHKFKLETLGDWNFDNNYKPIFTFKSMYVQCINCCTSNIIQ